MKKILPLIFLLLLLNSCRNNDKTVPKRYAYPRVEIYDTVYSRVSIGDVGFDINSAADTVTSRPGWLDIRYPGYGVTVHLSVNTFGSDEELDAALRNRYQRIGLNFEGTKTRSETFENGNGFRCDIVSSPEAGSAPINFVASSENCHLISGAAVFAGSIRPVDSIYPIFNAVYSDIEKLLFSLE